MTRTAKTASKTPKRDAAQAWLIAYLKDGSRTVSETRKQAKADGHNLTTLRDAVALSPITVTTTEGTPSYQLSGVPANNKAPIGRHPSYTEEIADKIVTGITDGQSIRTICSQDGMPSTATIFNWLGDDRYRSFLERYTRAKQDQAEQGFEKIMEITTDLLNGMVDPNTARVAIDSIKWQLGKLKPNKYGDKLQVQQDGNLTVTVQAFTNKGTRDLKRVGP